MFSKALFALSFAFGLIAAAPPPVVIPPLPAINAPPEVAADPANKLTLQLSNGGRVVIQMRPDLAPHHMERIQILVRQGFYNGLPFHPAMRRFTAQGLRPGRISRIRRTASSSSCLPQTRALKANIPSGAG